MNKFYSNRWFKKLVQELKSIDVSPDVKLQIGLFLLSLLFSWRLWRNKSVIQSKEY